MNRKNRLGFLSAVALSLLFVQGIAILHATGKIGAYLSFFYMYGDEVSDPLIYTEIQPRNQRVAKNEPIELNLEGVYTSKTMPVKADWFKVNGDKEERIDECRGTETCKVKWGESGLMLVKTVMQADEVLTDYVRVRVE